MFPVNSHPSGEEPEQKKPNEKVVFVHFEISSEEDSTAEESDEDEEEEARLPPSPPPPPARPSPGRSPAGSPPAENASRLSPARKPPSTAMPGQADQVPWRKPKLKKVERKGSVPQAPTAEAPPWAEDAKKRLGDVPVPLQKQTAPASKPEWAGKQVDADRLEELEKKHQERIPATPAQPDWTVKKMDATTLGRLERANKLDKMASFDKAPPDWADKRKSLDFSKLQELEAKAKAEPAPDVKPAQWESVKLVPPPPPPPPPPPRPPPPPPLPGKTEMTQAQREKLQKLKKTPRRRPDWATMMKEISQPRSMKHVECNDRSAPIIKNLKRKDNEFVFESEKEASATAKLLSEIRQGVKLKKVKTKDRSKPMLEGLRKLRRQKTSEAFLNLPPEELIDSEPEELDDIDKVRDDLQSTRQLLGEEVKDRERLIKENKHLKNEVKRLQDELDKLRPPAAAEEAVPPPQTIEAVASEPKADAEGAGGDRDGREAALKATGDELAAARQAEQQWAERCRAAEQEVAALRARLEQRDGAPPNGPAKVAEPAESDAQDKPVKQAKSRTKDKLSKMASQEKVDKGDAEKPGVVAKEDEKKMAEGKEPNKRVEESEESSEEDESSEEEPDSEEERRQELDQDRKKRLRELKMCKSKVWHINTKERHAKEERIQLKNRIKTLNQNLRDERRKYKELQREVRKLGAMMKGSDEEDTEEEEEEEEDEEMEESSSSSESGSETDDESSDESETDDETLNLEDRVQRMQERSKRHENTEKAIKKGNYMLKTTAERLFDKLRHEKEKYRALERELNELVNELG